MHSGALQAQRGFQARGAPQSRPRAVASSASSIAPATPTPTPTPTTTKKPFFYGVSDCSLSLPHPEVVIVHEKRRGFETVIPPGSSVRELLKADHVKVRRAFFFF